MSRAGHENVMKYFVKPHIHGVYIHSVNAQSSRIATAADVPLHRMEGQHSDGDETAPATCPDRNIYVHQRNLTR
jgi:hypothetical protein